MFEQFFYKDFWERKNKKIKLIFLYKLKLNSRV